MVLSGLACRGSWGLFSRGLLFDEYSALALEGGLADADLNLTV